MVLALDRIFSYLPSIFLYVLSYDNRGKKKFLIMNKLKDMLALFSDKIDFLS